MKSAKANIAGLTTRLIEGNKLVDAAIAAGGQFTARDSGREGVPGLLLRVTPSGTRTWSCVYVRKTDGVKRRATIGTFPEFSLEQARSVAMDIRADVARGGDPAQKVEPTIAYTFNTLADAWLAKHAERNKVPAAVADDKRILIKDVRVSIGDKSADAVTRTEIVHILDAMIERGAGVRANRALALIKSIYTWGNKTELVTVNPAAKVDKPTKERPRDRVLTTTEINAFWNGLGNTPMSPGIRLAMKLALVTGQRIGQVQAMSKAELELTPGNPVWTAAGANTKNGQANRTPLSPLALRLVAQAIALSGDSAFVFPSPSVEDAPVHATAATRAMTRSRKVLGLAHFTAHDLRRTCASHMAEMGILPGTIAHVLDHSSVTHSSVTSAVYIKYSFDREKRIALEAWGSQLEQILDGCESSFN